MGVGRELSKREISECEILANDGFVESSLCDYFVKNLLRAKAIMILSTLSIAWS